MRIAVIVASTNRAEEISQLLAALARQTLPPAAIILSVVKPADLPPELPAHIELIMGPPGLTAQRNRGLDKAQGHYDAVVFYDDDFVPARDSLQGIAEFFETYPEMAGATGHVLRDGVKGADVSYELALDIVRDYESRPRPPIVNEDVLFAYGCNMAFRSSAVEAVRFDEKLPLYAWQEDMDFAAQVAARGKVIRTSAFAGVHRGVKKGRSPGRPLGYSQVVNPFYLLRKGTMARKKAIKIVSRNIIANHVKMFWPEPHIDRRGRVLGNWIGMLHLLRGKADPTLILSFKSGPARAR